MYLVLTDSKFTPSVIMIYLTKKTVDGNMIKNVHESKGMDFYEQTRIYNIK